MKTYTLKGLTAFQIKVIRVGLACIDKEDAKYCGLDDWEKLVENAFLVQTKIKKQTGIELLWKNDEDFPI